MDSSSSPDIYDTGFRISPNQPERQNDAKTLVSEHTRPTSYFEAPEYDPIRPVLQDTLVNSTNQLIVELAKKAGSQSIFTLEEIDTLSDGLDDRLDTVIKQNSEEGDNVSDDIYTPLEFATSDEVKMLEDSEKRLIAAGYLAFDFVEDGSNGQKVIRVDTPGYNLRQILSTYNDLYITTIARQAFDSGKSAEEVQLDITKRFPTFSTERLNSVVIEVQNARNKTENGKISDLQLYVNLIKNLTGKNKIEVAEIAALSVFSSVTNLSSLEVFSQGMVNGNPLLMGIGGGLAMASHQSEVLKASITQKLMIKFMEGGDANTGVRESLLSQIYSLAPEISIINAGSLVINNPHDFEMQVARIRQVVESFPTQMIPSVINFISATSFLCMKHPDLATILPGILYGGGLTAIENMQATKRAPYERESREIGAQVTQAIADLQNVAPEVGNKINTDRLEGLLQQLQDRANSRTEMEIGHERKKVPPFAFLTTLRALSSSILGNVDFTNFLPIINAQTNEAMAVAQLSRSYLGVKSLLAPLLDLYNEVTAAGNLREHGRRPLNHNLSFRDIEIADAEDKPYLQIPGYLQINQGEKIVLDGPPGSGKSQFIELLYGKKIHKGLMTIGQHTHTETSISEYRRQIALKPQKPDTITASLGVNIGGADFDRDVLSQILIDTGLDRVFIEGSPTQMERNLPTEEDSNLIQEQLDGRQLASSIDKSSQGVRLSGGQRQLLALLRIEYQLKSGQDIKTIILDEPTNDLDGNAKQVVFSLITKWLDDPTRTIILTTHDEELKTLMAERDLRKITVERPNNISVVLDKK